MQKIFQQKQKKYRLTKQGVNTMKHKITSSILLMVPLLLFGQMINNYDAAPDPGYWGFESSDNADSLLSFVNVSYVTDPVSEGAGAMQLEYSVHNSEGFGGYTKLFHYVGGSDDEPGSPFEGSWKLAPVAGALGVGEALGNYNWWSSDEAVVTARACLFDDEYVFNADGSFQNVQGSETWLEAWQGTDPEACGAPVAPHDGTNAATWSVDEAAGTITVSGLGAYVGLAKVHNSGEDGAPVDDMITYNYSLSADGNSMDVTISGFNAGVPGATWIFKMVKVPTSDPILSGSWKLAPVAGALGVGEALGNYNWWSSDEAVVTARACLFDDEYVFNADGSFQNVQGSETWLEAWQGTDPEACGAPVAPHDGTNAATWSVDEAAGTITVSGLGAYVGLAKVHNSGEDGAPVDDMITYNYSLSADGNSMDVTISGFNAGVPGATWIFKMVKAVSVLAQENDWDEDWNTILDIQPRNDWNEDWNTILDLQPRDGEVWDWTEYDSISFSYNNLVSQSLEGRVQFRLNLNDYGDIANPTNFNGPGEYWYSFFYILDDQPGWNTVSLALDGVVDANQAQDGQFHMTGWVPGPGNGEVDKDAIGGFHLEFSISGSGDGDYSAGTIVFDDFTLTGSKNALTNPGFELADAQDDGAGWGAAIGGGHAEVVTDAAMAHSGDNYLSIGVTDNWAVFYTEDSIPAQYGETWRFSGFGKSVSGDGGGAALKWEAKDAAGTGILGSAEIPIAVTDEWENHSIEFVMPEGTVQMTAVIVASRWDGDSCAFAFDDMLLMSLGVLDVIAPDPVLNVSAAPASYYNLVTWDDNAGEEGEKYNVYASTEPITDSLSLSTADVVAVNVLEGAQAATHYLHNPLEDLDVTYYYAVACKDGSNNVGGPGSSEGSITNTAKGVPTISLTPPASFAADGDLQEWYDSGIMPFELGATANSYGAGHVGTGTVDGDADLHGTFYTAVDDDYFYLAAEIIDDVVNTEGSGGWWTADVVQLCLGLYDQRGPKHVGRQRGAEPDYKMYFTPAGANSDDGAGVLATHGDGNYFHEVFNPDYVFEFRISLDDILIEDDVRLTPSNGMRTPFEPMVYDNDGGDPAFEGQLTLSPTNNDNAHTTCEVWSNTWIGDQSTVDIDKEVIANQFALFPNYPNPFNPVTTIGFSLPNTQQVSLSVYNLIGQEVVSLVNKELPAGYHTINWYAGSMASGVYLSRLTSGGKTITQKMLLLK